MTIIIRDQGDSNLENSTGTASASTVQNSVNKVWMEGYLSKMGATKSIMSSTEWTRRYFVLKVLTVSACDNSRVIFQFAGLGYVLLQK